MSNFTSSTRVPALHGGQPYTSSHTEGTLPQSPRAGSGEGLPGSPYSKRPKSPEHLPPATIRRIKASQVLAGVRDPEVAQSDAQEPPPLTSAGSRAKPGWGEWLASWFSPDGDAATPPTSAGILTFAVSHPVTGGNYAQDYKTWVEVLKKFFGPGRVQVVSSHSPLRYPRNIATTTPDGTLITTEYGQGESSADLRVARDALEDHFRKRGLPVKRLATPTNFGSVEYVESKDVLIVARYMAPIGDLSQLKHVFGEPEHVLTVALDISKKHGSRDRCYDLDLAFHVTMNAKGEPVALLHADCLLDGSIPLEPPLLTAKEFREALVDLGFHIVDISEQEQLALATNSVSNPDKPGKLLFTRDQIPQSLVQKLAAAGIEAVPPNSKKWIGYTGPDYSMFGLHCLTLNIRIPVKEEVKEGL